MKKLLNYLLTLVMVFNSVFFISVNVQASESNTISFSDEFIKQSFLFHFPAVDSNRDKEVTLAELEKYPFNLNVWELFVSDLTLAYNSESNGDDSSKPVALPDEYLKKSLVQYLSQKGGYDEAELNGITTVPGNLDKDKVFVWLDELKNIIQVKQGLMPETQIRNRVSFFAASEDEIITFNDEYLKQSLLDYTPAIDANGDKEISVAELGAVSGSLDLRNNFIRDITGLEYATGITYLGLDNNYITDISPIANLSNLSSLNLFANNIASLPDMSGLSELRSIYLSYNLELSDISGICGASNLTDLMVDRANLSSLPSEISQLTKLQSLSIADNNVSDISVLANLSRLMDLNAYLNNITQIQRDTLPSSLASIYLVGNKIISADFSNISSLTYLYIDNNLLTEFNSNTLPQSLLILKASENDISNIDEVLTLDNLIALDLSSNALTELPEITSETLQMLTSLSLDNNEISDFSALGNLQSLETLSLANNRFTAIPDLSAITGLKTLDLRNNNISDISGLVGAGGEDSSSNPDGAQSYEDVPQTLLNSLQTLNLSYNSIKDIQPLSELANLQVLRLSSNEIDDISALIQLPSLKQLYLDSNNITSVAGINQISTLESLSLQYNQIGSVSALSGLDNLGYLILSNNQLSSLNGLNNLPSLSILELDSNNITSIDELSGLTSLISLVLSNNNIGSVSALSGLTGLRYLYLNRNKITDVSELSGLTNLRSVDLSQNELTSVSSLFNATNMYSLYVHNNQISDLTGIDKLTSLVNLGAYSNLISQLPHNFSSCSNLQYLELGNNIISDVSPLITMGKSLSTLYLRNNRVTNIAPLTPLRRLATLDLSYNRLDLTEGGNSLFVINKHIARGGNVYYHNQNPSIPETEATLTINVTNPPAHEYYISVSNVDFNINMFKAMSAGSSSAVFQKLPYFEGSETIYKVNVNGKDASGEYFSTTVDVEIRTNAETASVTISKNYKISGTLSLTDGSKPAPWTCVVATNKEDSSKIYQGYTNDSGQYTIPYVEAGTYTVGLAEWEKRYSTTEKEVSISSSSALGVDFTLNKGSDLRGSVKKDGVGVYKAQVTLWKKNSQTNQFDYVASTTCGETGFNFDSVLNLGDYKLVLDYVQERNSTFPLFESAPKEFTVSSLNTIYSENLTYIDPTQKVESFEGTVVSDITTASNGKHVSLKVNYVYNGETEITPQFKVVLPDGLVFHKDEYEKFIPEKSLKNGDSGKFYSIIKIVDAKTNVANIKVLISLNGGESWTDFCSSAIKVEKVTLFGPSAVKNSEQAIVYGETIEGTPVEILNAVTGEPLATVFPNGRFYSAKLPILQEGTHSIVAQAVIDKETETLLVVSDVLTVDSRSQQVVISNVKKDGQNLAVNPVIGVRTFSTWVDMFLKGTDFNISVDFENASNIQSIKFKFSDMEYNGVMHGSTATATISDWYGAGLKQLEAFVMTKDGKHFHYTVAEATILVDPSGVVTDSKTNAPVAGVTMTCYVLKNGNWVVWDAENYAQVNPMVTDTQGKYGWYVPNGTYKVTAYKTGYVPFDTLTSPSFSYNGQSTIIIPPPRDDVNIKLVATGANIPDNTPNRPSYGNTDTDTTDTENVSTPSTSAFDWNKTKQEISKASSGSTVTVQMNNETKLPASIINEIKGKDVNLVLKMGEFFWTINGKSVDKNVSSFQNVDMAVKRFNEASISTLAKNKDIRQLELAHSGNFPFKAVLGFNVGTSYSNKQMFMLYYNEASKKLEYVGSGLVNSSGTFNFHFAHASKYVLVSELGKGVLIKEDISSYKNKATVVPVYNSNGRQVVVSKSTVEDDVLKFVTPSSGTFDVINNSKQFKDVAGHWAEESIAYTSARNLFSGINEQTFEPNSKMTRAMLVTTLGKLEGIDLASYSNKDNFKDVNQADWYSGYVAWAAENGLVSGVGNNNFAPNQLVTREQMAVIITKYSEKFGYSLKKVIPATSFNDADEIASWSMNSVSTMQQAGIISGKLNNAFDPKGVTTKAEVSSVLRKLIDQGNF